MEKYAGKLDIYFNFWQDSSEKMCFYKKVFTLNSTLSHPPKLKKTKMARNIELSPPMLDSLK